MTESSRLWSRLLKPGFAFQFQTLFSQIAIRCDPINDLLVISGVDYHGYRTLKSAVKDELTIPEQKRYVVPIQLGRVERHVSSLSFLLVAARLT